ncbi:winged helix-turn-helix domain-containing protein [Nitrosospira briensis]|uniref:winged helix-turn-helix domain-containing protein n=1 Tax=Nitrosospira briensis TaxID=35799 RepID=UPI0004683AC1|nr:winged helix-turn-helix domain-containing protein [Nitrosospira briensis]
MARPATGREFVEAAKEKIASAKTVEALRAAQALLLPLEFGLSLEQTAVIIGLSKSRTGKLRTRFQRIETGAEQVKTKKGLRNHARMSLDEEVQFLAPFIAHAQATGILPIHQLKAELERRVGRSVSTSTVYQLLRRHGWSKLAHHAKTDATATHPSQRTAQKKNNPEA